MGVVVHHLLQHFFDIFIHDLFGDLNILPTKIRQGFDGVHDEHIGREVVSHGAHH